jgi:hypothetical protein
MFNHEKQTECSDTYKTIKRKLSIFQCCSGCNIFTTVRILNFSEAIDMKKRPASPSTWVENAAKKKKIQQNESCSIQSLEDRIKALENELEDSSSTDESSSDLDSEDERIPALPKQFLPEYYKKPKKGDDQRKGPRDSRNHSKRDEAFWQSRLNEALKAYVPSQNRALFCRLCQMDFADEGELYEHRSTEKHKRAVINEKELTYCRACEKKFTSVQQLKNHQEGKAHMAKINQRRGRKVGGTSRPFVRNGRGRGRGGRGRGRGRGRGGWRGRSRGRGRAAY